MTALADRPLATHPVPQRILNACDPSHGQVFEDGAIPCNASVVWEHDGEQLHRATAVRWCELAVLVAWSDVRNPAGQVWLSPRDVRET